MAVWTDLRIPDQLKSIRAVLWQGDVQRSEIRLLSDSGEAQPIVIRLSAAWMVRTEPVELYVEALDGSLVVVARRVRIPRLRAGSSAVAVSLQARCAGVGCPPDWTCAAGRCDRPDVPIDAVAASVEDLPSGAFSPGDEGRRVVGCVADADCEDGDPCTVDECAAHQCARIVMSPCVPCASDDVCAWRSTECMEGFCNRHGFCSVRARPPETPCDCGTDPCVVCCCRELGVCTGFDICINPDAVRECDGA